MSQRRLETDAQVKKLLANCKTEDERVRRYLRIAQQYQFIEEFSEAERYYLRYLIKEPSSYEAHRLLGELYLRIKRFDDAYKHLKHSHELHENKEILSSICQAIPGLPLGLQTKTSWLEKAEKANAPQAVILPLRETVLREGNCTTQDMEDVLREQAVLQPLEVQVHIKLLRYYADAGRYEDCLRIILCEEGKQEMGASPKWYRECQTVIENLIRTKAQPVDQPLIFLQLHVACRLALELITDPSLISDEEKGSLGMDDFFKQLEIFDRILDDAIKSEQWYREGQWSFVLDHFTGQLLYLYALGMLRRVDDSNREGAYLVRGQALMFCALEYLPKKIEAEQWFPKLNGDYRKVFYEAYLDGCYRTVSCYRCLTNFSSEPGFPDSVKVAASGQTAIKFVTERFFPGRVISAVYNQATLSRACCKPFDRSVLIPYETNACVKYTGTLERLLWLLLSGAEYPTAKVFSSLAATPNVLEGGLTPAQSDIDAFLSALLEAVRVFGVKMDILKPNSPRELMQKFYTTRKQRKVWNAIYRTFVNKVTNGRDVVQMKKTLNEGLEVIRGKDAKHTMPVWYLAQIARDLLRKGPKKNAYYGAAVQYYKLVLARLDDQTPQSVLSISKGGRSSPSFLFDFPKSMSISEDNASLRDEARLEIGKGLLFGEDLDSALQMFALIQSPKGYLYYARTAKQLCKRYVNEGDLETSEQLLSKAKNLLVKALKTARSDPELLAKIKSEHDTIDKDVEDTIHSNGLGGISVESHRAEVPVVQTVDLTRVEDTIKTEISKILVESEKRYKKIEDDLQELKDTHGSFIDIIAKMLADQKITADVTKAISQATTEISSRISQLDQKVMRVEELVSTMQTDCAEYQPEPPKPQSQLYGALTMPPGASLPKFNMATVAPHIKGSNPLQSNSPVSMTGAPPASSAQAVTPASQWRSPEEEAAAVNTKILFDTEGILFEETRGQSYEAVAGYCKICVTENATKLGICRSIWYFDSVNIYMQQDLSRVSAEMYESEDGSSNVQWKYNGNKYYIQFRNYSWQPGDVLARVFRDCGVTFTDSKVEAPSKIQEQKAPAPFGGMKQIASDSAVAKQPDQPRAFGDSNAQNMSTGFNTATPVKPLATVAKEAPTANTGTPKAAVTSFSGFKFESEAAIPKPVPEQKTPEKKEAVNPFASFSFGKTATSTPSVPAFGSAAATPSTNIFGNSAKSSPTVFGNPAAATPAANVFGSSAATTTNVFGKPVGASSSVFGNSASAVPSTNVFGNSPVTNPSTNVSGNSSGATPTTGIFGNAATPSPSSVFGSTTPAQSSSPAQAKATQPISSLFGKPAPNPIFVKATETPTASPFGSMTFGASTPAFGATQSIGSTVTPPKPSFSFATPAATTPAQPSEVEKVDEYEPSAQFEPVIELPDLVDVKTGEEDEESLFCERAKLYRFASETKEWKERGLGEMKILKHLTTKKYRILMRREQVLKICANHQILAGMKISPFKKETELTWMAPDFAEGEMTKEQFVIRFKTPEQAQAFKTTFEAGVEAAGLGTTPEKAPETPKAPASTKKPTNLFDKFKPAAGTWSCSACYVSNEATVTACVSCQTAKPGEKSEPKSSFEKFKAPAGSWECTACYVSNQSTAAKCVACETPQPGTGKTPSPVVGKPVATKASPSFLEKFKTPAGSWNCPTCCINNQPTVNECVACQTVKPGAVKAATAATAAPKSSFTFGVPANLMDKPTTKTDSPPIFGAKPSPDFVFGQSKPAAAGTPAPASFTFGVPASVKDDKKETTPTTSVGLTSLTSFSFGSPQKHDFSFEAKKGDAKHSDEEEVAESQDRDFAPVISLPPEIEVLTGEEGHDCLHSQRAKLFRFVNKEWKERGVGDLKILKNQETGKIRLTMRRDQVFKVCLNHYVTSDIVFKKRDDRSLEWNAVDFAEGEAEPTMFALRVKNKDICDKLMEALEDARNVSTATPQKKTPSKTSTSEVTTPVSAKSTASTKEPAKTKAVTPQPGPATPDASPKAQTPKKAEEPSDEVLIVEEIKASATDVARARALQLPDNFYLYESRHKECKGCRGCEKEEGVGKATEEKKEEEKPQPVKESAFAALLAKPTTPDPEKKETGGLFSGGNGLTFSALAGNSQGAGFSFATGKPSVWETSGNGSFFSAFSKSSVEAKQADPSATEEGEVAPSDDIHFDPVVPMPDIVEVKTGEEEEEVVFQQRSKLYVFHAETNEWKERAVGEVKILECADGRSRVVMRREIVHKVACNHYITPNMELKPLNTSKNAVTWSAVDFAEGDSVPTTFALRMKNEERMNKFKQIFNERIEKSKTSEVTTPHAEPEHSTNEEDTDDAEEEDDDNILLKYPVAMSEEIPIGESKWTSLGSGFVLIYYNDELFGSSVQLLDESEENVLAETIIAVQTSLRTDGLEATWMAQDIQQEPSNRRRFRVKFSKQRDFAHFCEVFSEGKENAVQLGIVERENMQPTSLGRFP